ncbi:wax ester synthase/diacylglycerol acyltransferase 6-like isoform X1 [Spinacia oleracea]|uniref:Wax ester synthase/diacylglycerol acyltransferase 6-like isoform X1 n=1 Tax=Spinacia oleracea TaxID=3562 RepID=A0ABM3QIG0_SPIOL|nr:wax ester synthase/diacylglycerol acyltransferase 6-like isoform X1 [Spinacia oleracea]
MDMRLRVNTKSSKVNTSLELHEVEEVEPVSPTSEYFLSEVVTLYVLAFLELANPIDFTSILAFLKDVFLNIHPRFSSVVVEDKRGRKSWKKVRVNVEDHIKIPNFPKELSPENYSQHFDDYVSKIATSQLPQHKPLWELHIINNPKHIDAAGIFIFKIDHAIGDGTSLMGGVLTCFKRVDDPSLPISFPRPTTILKKRNNNTSQTLMNMLMVVPKYISSIFYSLYEFGQGVGTMFLEDDRTPIRSGKTDMSRLGSTRVCSLTLSLNHVKTIKGLLGVTVNDIIVGIIFLGTRLYIQETETDQGRLKKDTRSTASIFVNIRNVGGNLSVEEMRKGKTWGNRITNIEIPLPNLEVDDVTNPLQFIQKAHTIIKRKRTANFGLYLMSGLLEAIRTVFGLQMCRRYCSGCCTLC